MNKYSQLIITPTLSARKFTSKGFVLAGGLAISNPNKPTLNARL